MLKQISIVMILAVIIFFQASNLANAQDSVKDKVSVQEQENALRVQNLVEIAPLQVPAHDLGEVTNLLEEGKLYKVGECITDSEICYVRRMLLISQSQITNEQYRNPVSQTYTCGLTVYNGFGTIVGRVQQNVNITGTPNPLGGWTYPLRANWADSRGTGTSFGYTITEIVGPIVTPGFNQWTNTLNSTIDVSFQLATPIPGQSQRATSRLLLDAWQGFICS